MNQRKFDHLHFTPCNLQTCSFIKRGPTVYNACTNKHKVFVSIIFELFFLFYKTVYPEYNIAFYFFLACCKARTYRCNILIVLMSVLADIACHFLIATRYAFIQIWGQRFGRPMCLQGVVLVRCPSLRSSREKTKNIY